MLCSVCPREGVNEDISSSASKVVPRTCNCRNSRMKTSAGFSSYHPASLLLRLSFCPFDGSGFPGIKVISHTLYSPVATKFHRLQLRNCFPN